MRKTPLKRLGKWTQRTGAKYSNQVTAVNGKSLHSKLEADRYTELLLLEKGKAISALETQKRFPLDLPSPKTGQPVRICVYVCDFFYLDKNGREHVEDTKGVETDLFRIKKRLMYAIYGIDVEVLKRKDVGRHVW